MHATTDFEAGYKAADATQTETVADPERQETKIVAETQNLGHMREGGQSEGLRDSMQGMQTENAELHAASTANKAARTKRLLAVYALRVKKVAQKKELKSRLGDWQRECQRGKGALQRGGTRRTPWLS